MGMNWRALLAVFLVAGTARAQALPPVPEFKLKSVPEGEDKIQAVFEGRGAPYTGQLFSNETALRWANWLEQYRLQLPILLDTQRQVCLAEIAYRDNVLKFHDEGALKIQNDLTQRLERLELKNTELQVQLSKGPAWYDSREFGIVLGVVGTGALVFLSAWALNQAAK